MLITIEDGTAGSTSAMTGGDGDKMLQQTSLAESKSNGECTLAEGL